MDNPSTLRFALNQLHYALWAQWVAEPPPAVAEEQRDLAMVLGDTFTEFQGRRWCRSDRLVLGDLSGVDRELTAMTRLAEQRREPMQGCFVVTYRLMGALMAGEYRKADVLLEELRAVNLRIQGHPVEHWIRFYTWQRLYEQGRWAEAIAESASLATAYPDCAPTRAARMFSNCDVGNSPAVWCDYDSLSAL